MAVKKRSCKIARLRFNTESDGKRLLWRLVIDGEELLFNSVQVQKPCSTTTDWLEDKQCYKHHISAFDCDIYIDDERLEAIIK